ASTGRRSRRASIANFRREIAVQGLVTCLVPIDFDLSAEPRLERAREWWLSRLPAEARRCFCCHMLLTPAAVGALLLSRPWQRASTAVGVLGACRGCFTSCSMEELSDHATIALWEACPHGHFVDSC